MLAAFHLTRSFHRADELVEASPDPRHDPNGSALPDRDRAGADRLAVAGALLRLHARRRWMRRSGCTASSRTPTSLPCCVGHSVVAAVGGTLLGVAAGRWWGFRGASAVLVLAVVVWTIGVLGAFSSGDTAPAAWTRWLRLFAPVGYFTSATPDNTVRHEPHRIAGGGTSPGC